MCCFCMVGSGCGAVLELSGLKLPGFGWFWYFLVCLVFFCALILGIFGGVLGFLEWVLFGFGCLGGNVVGVF